MNKTKLIEELEIIKSKINDMEVAINTDKLSTLAMISMMEMIELISIYENDAYEYIIEKGKEGSNAVLIN
jgi:hypothetical protein